MKPERSSGILLHPTSLPGAYGIGTLGREAYRFVDFLAAARQTVWQVLPLGPTGYADSPYACLSAFAGNPLLIDLELLAKGGWLSRRDLAGYIEKARLDNFRRHHRPWLDDFALFMALKYRFELKPWTEWPAPIRDRQPASLRVHARMLADDVEFHVFLPHTYEHDCVVYTGTHDNDTLLGWYRHAKARDKRYAREYLNAGEKSIAWGFINAAWSSVAGLALTFQ